METRKRYKQHVDGDLFRKARWNAIHQALSQTLVVVDCINILEQYDATQVIDMKVYRTKTQVWLQRYHIDTDELMWICPLALQEWEWDLCPLKGRLYQWSGLPEDKLHVLNLNYSSASLVKGKKNKNESVANYPDFFQHCCTTPGGKIYLVSKQDYYEDKISFNIYLKLDLETPWIPFYIEYETSGGQWSMVTLGERFFIMSGENLIEMTTDGVVHHLPTLPIFTSIVSVCQYDDNHLFIGASDGGTKESMHFFLFHINTSTWKEIPLKISGQFAWLVNINHTIYALSESVDTRQIVKIDPVTNTKQFIESKLSLADMTTLCVYVPKI